MLFRKYVFAATAIMALAGGLVSFADDASDTESAQSTSGPVSSGFYLRGQAGYGWAEAQSAAQIPIAGLPQPLQITTDTQKSRGFAGRIGVGYAFNPYFSLETGFNLYPTYYRNLSMGGIPLVQAHTSLYALDLMGKASIPFDQFYAFVEGGAAYAFTDTSLQTTVRDPVTGASVDLSASEAKGFLRPKAGVGLGYNITPNVGVEVSYDRLFGKGNVTDVNDLPSENVVALGLTYRF